MHKWLIYNPEFYSVHYEMFWGTLHQLLLFAHFSYGSASKTLILSRTFWPFPLSMSTFAVEAFQDNLDW